MWFPRWYTLAMVCIALLIGSTLAQAAPPVFTERLNSALYDCTLALTPAANLSETSAVRVDLEAGGKTAVRVEITRQAITIEQNDKRRLGEIPSGVTPGKKYAITLMRRGTTLGLLRGDAVLLRVEAPRGTGDRVEITAGPGWTLDDARVQPLEPVAFADNFMRAEGEKGLWKLDAGQWTLQSAWDADPKGNVHRFEQARFAQNPFAWVGVGKPGGSALCTAGQPFWEDYTFSAAVRPGEGGAVGLAVNMTGTDGLLARWTPANDRGAGGNRLTLCRLAAGKLSVLQEDPGGFIPGQWYRLAIVSAIGEIRVSVDGRERLAVKDVTPWRGGVGLYAEGPSPATFDDVTAYGRALNTGLLAEARLLRASQQYQDHWIKMDEWASWKVDWQQVAGDYFVHRREWYGDHRIILNLTPVAFWRAGELTLTLCGDGRDPATGYRVTLQQAEGLTQSTVTLYRNSAKLAGKSIPALKAGEKYQLRFLRAGKRICLEIDGQPVVEALDPAPLDGRSPAYRATAAFSRPDNVLVVGDCEWDYTFAEAPVDWLADGAWMPTTRWSCSSQWSFLGGWGRGDAALWHKGRFNGDHALQAFVALKMEYPRERQTYWERPRDFGLVICGDGHDPRSGYSAILGAPDKNGTPNARAVLLRNGVEVATGAGRVPGAEADAHTHWVELQLGKQGNVIEFRHAGNLLLRYADPRPLAGGASAIWTSDNGIAVARARLRFADPPQPRNDPRVILDEPWYPEWANVGQPLTLEFTGAWSTSGKPVRLQSMKRLAPVGQPAPEIRGTSVSLTPKTAGDYWYGIDASDGETRSPDFQLFFPAFTPSLGRDDSHALLLYRFDEGKGDVVHDHSTVAPPVDLALEKGGAMRWLPGQGMALHINSRLLSTGGVDKLMAIARSRACTVEMWVSNSTIYPPTETLGYFFSWERPGAPAQNFAVAMLTGKLLVLSQGTAFTPYCPGSMLFKEMRTGLQHVVVTWDGTKTVAYVNGRQLGTEYAAWSTDRWSPDARVVLGDQLNPQQPQVEAISKFIGIATYILEPQLTGHHTYPGIYYLFALHDRCLPPADIQRHYQAGPSAR
ncbi:MAG: hypothetical protein ACYC7E_15990 [Armatimonadota bacterium]